MNFNSNVTSIQTYSILVNKSNGSYNNIIDSYVELCISDIVKDMNIQLFNLMSRTNETKHLSWHKTCKFKYKLDASVCNDQQRWNNGKCRCECKEFIDKGRCS